MTQKGLPVRQAGLAPILIVLILAALIGGYLVYSDKIGVFQNQPKPTPSSTTQSTPQPSPISDSTANWKTYTNSEYKFEFSYHSDWTIKETTYPVKDEGWLFAVLIGSPDKKSLIDITVSADPKKTINTLDGKGAIKSNVGVIPAWKQQAGEKGKVYTFSSVINNQIVQVVYGASPESSEKELSIMDQILSTFKFLP